MEFAISKTIAGLEDAAAREIKELFGINLKIEMPGRVKFDGAYAKEFSEKTKTCNTVYLMLRHFKFGGINKIIENVESIDFSFINEDFVVRCSRLGKHDFNSNDVEKRVGEILFNKGYKVNLKSEEVVYVDIFDDKCIIGRLVKDGIGKRNYRVKTNNQSITPIIASCLLNISGWKKTESLLDPFCKDGTILIEAGLNGGKKLHGCDDENNVRNARINSALAKLKIRFCTKEELKGFKEKSIDTIITNLPFTSKRRNETEVKRSLNEFLEKTCVIAKKKIVAITRNEKDVDNICKKIGFLAYEKRAFSVGGQKYSIMAFKPKNRGDKPKALYSSIGGVSQENKQALLIKK